MPDQLIDDNIYNKMDSRPNNQPLDLDDVPIPVSKPKTFEQLLAEEMTKGNGAGGIIARESPSRQRQDMTAQRNKKDFLKRKTTPTPLPKPERPSSKYRYYVDNFKAFNNANGSNNAASDSGDKGFEKRRGSHNDTKASKPDLPSRALEKSRTQHESIQQQTQSMVNTEKPSFKQWEEDEANKEQPKVEVKRKFLTRGSGVAGGGKALESSNLKTP